MVFGVAQKAQPSIKPIRRLGAIKVNALNGGSGCAQCNMPIGKNGIHRLELGSNAMARILLRRRQIVREDRVDVGYFLARGRAVARKTRVADDGNHAGSAIRGFLRETEIGGIGSGIHFGWIRHGSTPGFPQDPEIVIRHNK